MIGNQTLIKIDLCTLNDKINFSRGFSVDSYLSTKRIKSIKLLTNTVSIQTS